MTHESLLYLIPGDLTLSWQQLKTHKVSYLLVVGRGGGRFSRASKMLKSQTIAGTRGSVLNQADGGGVLPDTFEPTLGRQLPTGHA